VCITYKAKQNNANFFSLKHTPAKGSADLFRSHAQGRKAKSSSMSCVCKSFDEFVGVFPFPRGVEEFGVHSC
jgi:hypothetical protein